MTYRSALIITFIIIAILPALSQGPWQTEWNGSPAVVVIYDNSINFGDLEPCAGRDAASRVAIAAGQKQLPPLGPVDGVQNYDLAGLQVYTSLRLGMNIDMGGNLYLAQADGTPSPSVDTRKTSGRYELRTEYKVNYHGLFLNQDGVTPFFSPTTGTMTSYNNWTGWGTSGLDGEERLADETGWLSPAANDAWTGAASSMPAQTSLSMQVAPNQGQGAQYLPAEIWFAERVIRRGLQDVSGNYRQNISIHLYFAEN